MINPETHRQFYLAAAGIRMWYAKRPLPGAAPSPEFRFPDEDLVEDPVIKDQTAAIPQPTVEARQVSSTPSRSVSLQSLMAPPAKAEVPVPAAEPAPPREPALTGLEAPAATAPLAPGLSVTVHLGFWSTEQYLLISEWSDEASERLQDSLAGNLLKALHQPDAVKHRMLHWPVFRNPQIPGNSLEDFRGVLSRMVGSYDQSSIILLGVLGDVPAEHRQYCLQPLLARVAVDFPYSLAQLSSSPAHKRDLWQDLKSRYSL